MSRELYCSCSDQLKTEGGGLSAENFMCGWQRKWVPLFFSALSHCRCHEACYLLTWLVRRMRCHTGSPCHWHWIATTACIAVRAFGGKVDGDSSMKAKPPPRWPDGRTMMQRTHRGHYCAGSGADVLELFVPPAKTRAGALETRDTCEAFCVKHAQCGACSVACLGHETGCAWTAIKNCVATKTWAGDSSIEGDVSFKVADDESAGGTCASTTTTVTTSTATTSTSTTSTTSTASTTSTSTSTSSSSHLGYFGSCSGGALAEIEDRVTQARLIPAAAPCGTALPFRCGTTRSRCWAVLPQ